MLYNVFESIQPVAAFWDSFLPDDHQLRSKHLIPLEESAGKDLRFRYLLFREQEGDEPNAIAYFQLIHFGSEHYQFPILKNGIGKVFEKWIMKRGFHILICGNLFRIDVPGIYFNPVYTSAGAVAESLATFYRSVSPSPHAILIKDWQTGWETKWVDDNQFHRWENDLTMKLSLRPEWKNFEDYVASLKHHYAQRLRKTRKKLTGVVRKELSLQEITDLGHEIEQLYLQVTHKQIIRMVIVNKDYFIKLKLAYGKDFRVFGYFLDEKLVAFSSNIIYQRLWESHYIGIDYAFNEEKWLYFNILLDCVSDAILEGKEELEFGRTAREAKASIGCVPEHFVSFVRLRGTLVNWLVNRFAYLFNEKAPNTLDSRHPFKSDNINYVPEKVNPNRSLP